MNDTRLIGLGLCGLLFTQPCFAQEQPIEQQAASIANMLFQHVCVADFLGKQSVEKTVTELGVEEMPKEVAQYLIKDLSNTKVYNFSNNYGAFAVAHTLDKNSSCTVFSEKANIEKFSELFFKNMPLKPADGNPWMQIHEPSTSSNVVTQDIDIMTTVSEKPMKIGEMHLYQNKNPNTKIRIALNIAFTLPGVDHK